MAGVVWVEIFARIFPLLVMAMSALGFYALGKWLRKHGHGARLDKVCAIIVKFKNGTSMIFSPLAIGAGRLGCMLNSVPFLGSKQQRQQWGELEIKIVDGLKMRAKN